eukprot:2237141-Rhodomonas_salina.1
MAPDVLFHERNASVGKFVLHLHEAIDLPGADYTGAERANAPAHVGAVERCTAVSQKGRKHASRTGLRGVHVCVSRTEPDARKCSPAAHWLLNVVRVWSDFASASRPQRPVRQDRAQVRAQRRAGGWPPGVAQQN